MVPFPPAKALAVLPTAATPLPAVPSTLPAFFTPDPNLVSFNFLSHSFFPAKVPPATPSAAGIPIAAPAAPRAPTPATSPAVFFIPCHAFLACSPTPAISPSLPPIPPFNLMSTPNILPSISGTCLTNINIPTIRKTFKTDIQSPSVNALINLSRLFIKNK